MSSGQLFSTLDDASENTFLCGTAVLIQKYIFDGGAGKIGLETKNIVACTSFVVEQKLVSFFPFFSFFWAQLLPKFQCFGVACTTDIPYALLHSEMC